METQDNTYETIVQEAALWYARLDSGSADLSAFETWRGADPRHAVAFAQIAGASALMDDVRLSGSYQGTRSSWRPTRRQLMTAAGLATLFAASGGIWTTKIARAQGVTGFREYSHLRLPDGGFVELNSDTLAQWKFGSHTRRIWLKRGEIALSVPSDPRPCQLYAGDSVLNLDTGTIDIRLCGKAIDLKVIKGDCSVSPTGASPDVANKVVVNAGQAANSSGAFKVRSVSDDDLQFVTGWRIQQVVLSGQTLSEAVNEYNRYLNNKIVIADPSLANLRLGGRFDSHFPDEFLRGLHESFGIQVSRAPSGAYLLTRQADAS